jgi:hypothetical protein
MKAGEAAGVGQNLLYLNGRPNKDFESEDYACVASLKETLIYL